MPTIIHVDDDDTTLDINDVVLSEVSSATVIGAANAAEALHALSDAEDPTLLMTDYWMPDMTGLHLAQQCRDRFPDRDIKILILTGTLDDELEERTRATGIGLVWKHIDLEEYRAALSSAVQAWASPLTR